MEKRRLGRSPLEIPPLVFGTNVFGWTVDQPTAFTLLDTLLERGFNCLDTADVYSRFAPGNVGGESETVIGNWLAQGGRRDKVIIATKLGMDMGADKKGLSRAYIHSAVEASLCRLQTDYIDLYQAHADDVTIPFEETLGAFQELIDAGKVRAIGASNFRPERFAQALDVSESKGLPRYESMQPWYNLYDRGMFEGGLEQICLDRQVGVICYFGLASGFLSGKYRTEADLEGSPRAYRARAYLNERGLRILSALDEVAGQLGATPAQVALAWLMQRPSVTAPIASATSLAQLEQLMGAAQLSLEAGHIELLDSASEQAPGTPAAGMEVPPGGR